MKRYTSIPISVLCLSFILTLQLFSQDPDAWEANQTSYQPPGIVLKAIELKEGMVVGEIGAGRGRYSVIPSMMPRINACQGSIISWRTL